MITAIQKGWNIKGWTFPPKMKVTRKNYLKSENHFGSSNIKIIGPKRDQTVQLEKSNHQIIRETFPALRNMRCWMEGPAKRPEQRAKTHQGTSLRNVRVSDKQRKSRSFWRERKLLISRDQQWESHHFSPWQHWKQEDNEATLSTYRGKIISNLEFYTQPTIHK